MRKECRTLAVIIALMSLLIIFAPHASFAQVGATSECDSGGSKASLDQTVANNNAAYAQDLYVRAQNVNSLFPIVQATNACVQKLTDLIAQLPTMGNPFNLGQALIMSLITSVINQVCSSVAGVITSAQNALTSFAHICLPLPHFGGLDLPQFSTDGCSGGTQLNLLTSFSPPGQPPAYNYQQYMSR